MVNVGSISISISIADLTPFCLTDKNIADGGIGGDVEIAHG